MSDNTVSGPGVACPWPRGDFRERGQWAPALTAHQDLLWTLCGLWRGKGDLPGPHGLVARTARARLVVP